SLCRGVSATRPRSAAGSRCPGPRLRSKDHRMGVRQFSVSGAGRAFARQLARALIMAGAAATLSGCIITGYEKPDLNLDVPDKYTAARPGPESALPPLDWWRSFGSRELTLLMEEAQTANLDIAAAVARIQQADALVRIANASLLPTLD